MPYFAGMFPSSKCCQQRTLSPIYTKPYLDGVNLISFYCTSDVILLSVPTVLHRSQLRTSTAVIEYSAVFIGLYTCEGYVMSFEIFLIKNYHAQPHDNLVLIKL
ncbi:uncharacterized protein F5891DRAFT_1037809 [Suillus fuscotomentosus]|uniref:Uncharacterized protein n=1 Tax=Suillus fuscotomentosus TaxID=1912939 RepID=A0AAD4E503_9AGAM|nr:uncharacterized protein F5891DRAFT_1037809 [Suillus fuscotomentosus]KAG1899677.1 hypothetical protein F5891DRAFT_1037809 [Suillus fuscotomentosus]